MVGHRKTHDYPYGKPFPLALLGIAMAALLLSWIFFVPGHWPRAIVIIAALLVLTFINGKLHTRYEESGQAVRLPRPRVVTRFPARLPIPMMAARFAFFITVTTMIIFGLAPLADRTARLGIVVCVFSLIGVAVLNLVIERYYVKIGVAQEVDVSNGGKADT